MASYTIFSIIIFISILSIPPSFSSSFEKDVSFQAPLIHRSSPQSPFYDPNAKPADIMKAAIQNSLARSEYFSRCSPSNASVLFARTPISMDRGVDYVMSYYIGTPPVKTFGIPDTGSPLTWLQCIPCKLCFNQSIPVFDPRTSSTYYPASCDICPSVPDAKCDAANFCTYHVEYLDNAFSEGIIATETITLPDNGITGNNTIEKFIFGCGDYNVDSPPVNPPGIVGLTNHTMSLVGQLLVTKFSYCIFSNESGSHGWMRFGVPAVISGHDTPLLPNKHGLYHIKFKGISVSGDALEIPMWPYDMTDDEKRGFIIDMGSTYTLLHSSAMDVLVVKIKEEMFDQDPKEDELKQWKLCYKDVTVMPEIEFHFEGGLNFPLSNANAWTKVDDELYCLAILSTREQSMLGVYQQRNVNVGFDLQRSRVAFTFVNDCPEKLF